MNRILTSSIAALALGICTPAAFAEHGGGHGGGGGHAGGGGSRGGGMAMHGGGGFHGGGVATRGGGGSFHGGGGAFRTGSSRSFAATPSRSFATEPPRSYATVSPRSVSAPRNFNRNTITATGAAGRYGGRATTPTMAFGGRGFANRGYSGGGRLADIPAGVSRGWDRGHHHHWNNHDYGWDGGSGGWVILDNGYYDSPYYADSGYDYPYATDTYTAYTAPAYNYSGGSVSADVQDALAQNGFYNGPIDGIVGPQTREAIAEFQRSHGLPVTGRISGSLLRALGIS